jgi:hypothetical protein
MAAEAPAKDSSGAKGAPGGYRSESVKVAGTTATKDRDGDGIMDATDKADEPPPPAPPVPGSMHGGQGGAAPPPPAINPSPAQPPRESRPPGPAGKEKGGEQPATEEKHTQLIIYTARVNIAVYQVEQGIASVEKIAKEQGGYLALKRDNEITIRVPRARFEPALSLIDKIGDILHRDIQAQDVTDDFVDTEIRIKNARAMQVRLRTLLERAAVKEALEIEKELARVTQELELLEGKLKLLKDKIAFSTITVTFAARGSTIQASRVRLPFPFLSQIGLPSLLSLDEAK